MLARVAEEVHGVGITQRHQQARRARAVWVTDDLDGMSTLHAYLPSVLAHGVKDRLDQMAHALRAADKAAARRSGGASGNAGTSVTGACTSARDCDSDGTREGVSNSNSNSTGEGVSNSTSNSTRVSTSNSTRVSNSARASAGENSHVAIAAVGRSAADAEATTTIGEYRDSRTVDQVRADIFADLLLTNAPSSVDTAIGSIRATVAITIPVLTLLGREDDGAELDGAVPVDADTARFLTGGAPGFDRVLTHPITGGVLATDRYRPTADMKRFLTHRDQHCRHPGCRVPIRYTDIDHNHEWADGGETNVANLAPLCRRHHTLKTSAGWKITPHPAGVVEYITPAGYHYIEDPEPRTVTFTMPLESDHGRNDSNSDSSTSDGEPPW